MISLSLTPDPAQLSVTSAAVAATGDALLSADAFAAVLTGGDKADVFTIAPRAPRDAPVPIADDADTGVVRQDMLQGQPAPLQVAAPVANVVPAAPINDLALAVLQSDLPITPVLPSIAPDILPDPSWPKIATAVHPADDKPPLHHHDIARPSRHAIPRDEGDAPSLVQPDASTPTPLIQWALFAKTEAVVSVPQVDKAAEHPDQPSPIAPEPADATTLLSFQPLGPIPAPPPVDAVVELEASPLSGGGQTKGAAYLTPAPPADLTAGASTTMPPEPYQADNRANNPAPPATGEDLIQAAPKQANVLNEPRSVAAQPVAQEVRPTNTLQLDAADEARPLAPRPFASITPEPKSHSDGLARAAEESATNETKKAQPQLLGRSVAPMDQTAAPVALMPLHDQGDFGHATIFATRTFGTKPPQQAKTAVDLPVPPILIPVNQNGPGTAAESVVAVQIARHVDAPSLNRSAGFPPDERQKGAAMPIKIDALVGQVVLPAPDDGVADTVILQPTPDPSRPPLVGQTPMAPGFLREPARQNAPPQVQSQPLASPVPDVTAVEEPVPAQGAVMALPPVQAMTPARPYNMAVVAPTVPGRSAVNILPQQPFLRDGPTMPTPPSAIPLPHHSVSFPPSALAGEVGVGPKNPADAPAAVLIPPHPTKGVPTRSAVQQPPSDRKVAVLLQPPAETRPINSRLDAQIAPILAGKLLVTAEKVAVQIGQPLTAPLVTPAAAVAQIVESARPAEPDAKSAPTPNHSPQSEQSVIPPGTNDRTAIMPVPAAPPVVEGIGRHRVEPPRLPVFRDQPSSRMIAPPATPDPSQPAAIPEPASTPLTGPVPLDMVTLPATPGIKLQIMADPTPSDKSPAPQLSSGTGPAVEFVAMARPDRVVHAGVPDAKMPSRTEEAPVPPLDVPRQTQGLAPSTRPVLPEPFDNHLTPPPTVQNATATPAAAVPNIAATPTLSNPMSAQPEMPPTSNTRHQWAPSSAVQGGMGKIAGDRSIPPDAGIAALRGDQDAAPIAKPTPYDSVSAIPAGSNGESMAPQRQRKTEHLQSNSPVPQMAALPAALAQTAVVPPAAASPDRQRRPDDTPAPSTDQRAAAPAPTVTVAAPPPPPPAVPPSSPSAQPAFNVASTPREARRLPHGLAPAIARAASRVTRESQVELTLDPVELGKLRFEIITTNDRTQINLSVERADTLDLLRRHADILRAEFREAGFDGASLNFSQWTRQGNEQSGGQTLMRDFEADDPTPSKPDVVPQRNNNSAGQGLDLRL